ncbi:hypothetical protein MVEN_02618000 [Mycena venus]|uniref:ARM repeat-containing protein n=1 Tax=Mycena venus TaxID=2733690 RepID=A0A8H6WT11_9AGAR|nr:hypothetical protein MVEN_02618000 [Mycena venus]
MSLSRQGTRQSILSWWSDRNPGLPGPTINLHAAAKPLSRFLYHRQALEIIRKNHGSPLSSATLEIYSSYFPWDYVSWSTKAAIMAELADSSVFEDNARVMVESPVFDHITQMLESPDAGTASAVLYLDLCVRLVSLLSDEHFEVIWGGNLRIMLATHESTASAILDLKLFVPLVSLLRDDDSQVIEWAIDALTQIARWSDGGRAIVDVKALNRILELLKYPSTKVQEWACKLVGTLASQESTAPVVLESKPCVPLVSLWRGFTLNHHLIEWVMDALTQIALRSDGAQAIVDAKALDHDFKILESPNAKVREWTCKLVGRLAIHESIVPAILEINPCVPLVSLLRDDNSKVIEWAIDALAQIARWSDGAQAVVYAKVMDHLSGLLESPNPDTRKNTCELLGRLATHESTVSVMLEMNLYVRLVSCLCDEHTEVLQKAMGALCGLARQVDGAQAIVSANATDHILILLESPHREWACDLVGSLARYASTAPAILELRPCVPLVSLLHDGSLKVVEWAIYALFQIARWPDGAKAIIDAKALVQILQLLESPSASVREWTCRLVGRLAIQNGMVSAILQLNLCVPLVSLMRDDNSECALSALTQIATSPDGAQAIIDVKVLQQVPALLESPRLSTRTLACILVTELASHQPTAPAILNLKLSSQLVALLLEPNVHVETRDTAILALEAICNWPDGVADLGDIRSDVFDRLEELGHNHLPHADVQLRTRRILDNLPQ